MNEPKPVSYEVLALLDSKLDAILSELLIIGLDWLKCLEDSLRDCALAELDCSKS